MQKEQFCFGLIGPRHSVWQRTERSFAELRSKQIDLTFVTQLDTALCVGVRPPWPEDSSPAMTISGSMCNRKF